MLINTIKGKYITDVKIDFIENNVPTKIIMTFSDKSQVTIEADGFCGYHGSYLSIYNPNAECLEE